MIPHPETIVHPFALEQSVEPYKRPQLEKEVGRLFSTLDSTAYHRVSKDANKMISNHFYKILVLRSLKSYWAKTTRW